MENSRKVNYSWEKKKSAVFPLNLCMVLFLSSSVPFTLFSPLSACSHQPLISISQPLQHQASRVGCSLFILYFLQQCRKRTKEKMSWTLKGPWPKAAVQKKPQQNNLKAKALQFLHTFLVHTKKCTSVLRVKIKDVRHKQCTELGKSTNTKVHRLLYPHPRQEGISQMTFICHRPLSKEQDPSAFSCQGGRYGKGKDREAFLWRQERATGTEQVMR